MNPKRILLSFTMFLVMLLSSFQAHAGKIPLITEAQKAQSIQTIMESGEVVRATITQKGRNVFLTIIADVGILEMNAKQLARSFVRAVKIYSPDRYQDEKALGTGIYDYRVTVRDAGEKDLVIGVKKADQSTLVWTLPPK
jgi:hypothetical protein